jgi:hypothetical protein
MAYYLSTLWRMYCFLLPANDREMLNDSWNLSQIKKYYISFQRYFSMPYSLKRQRFLSLVLLHIPFRCSWDVSTSWTRSMICYFGNKGLGFPTFYLDLVVNVAGVLGRANVWFLTAARAVLKTRLDCCLLATGCSYGRYNSRSVEVSPCLS